MSRLDELIKELCPDGVEYKALSDVCQLITGATPSKANKAYWENGTIPWMSSGEVNLKRVTETEQKITQLGYDKTSTKLVPKHSIVIALAGQGKTRGKVAITEIELCTNQSLCSIICKDCLDYKFLYYYLDGKYEELRTISNGDGTRGGLSLKILAPYKIPVPPLELQHEVVRILDNFTELTDELTAKLTAELTARQKQYEFYRDKLLDFSVLGGGTSECAWKTLAEIADISTGSSNTNEAVDDGIYPFYVRSQEPLRKNDYEYDEAAIITAGDGVGVGKVFHFVEGKYALHQRAYRIHINTPAVLPRYYFHYMRSAFLPYIQKTMFQGSVASIRRPMLNQFPVPIPPVQVQERLVNVLDNFETICSDLNIGLPAEIEARQKQYEYYRDMLLTFAESGNTISRAEQSRAEQSRAEQSRAEQSRAEQSALIKLLQYVFGYTFLPLSKIANVFRGEYITKKNAAQGDIPVILGGQEPAYYIDKYNHDGEIVVVARSGASAGFVSYWDQKIFVTDGFGYEAKCEVAIPKYLYYVLKNREQELNGMQRGAGVPHVSGEMLGNIVLPVPPLQEQNRIVTILDRFATLCNDLSAGLPAEIEARRKQYEYYRDKLLSFKELQK